ncbi:MAG TPA: response regulator transcription factor [Lacunisphaera sp.]
MNITSSLQSRLFAPSAGSRSPLAQSTATSECETLPVDETAPGLAASAERLNGCVTVMLVEERTLVRQGINSLLADRNDITVIGEAADCRQAYGLAEKLRPDVVIISLSLVLRNGPESLRCILEAAGGARALVLTPHYHNNVLTEHVAISGVAGFLTEQAGTQLLATAVREVHTQNHFSDEAQVPPVPSPAPVSRYRHSESDADFPRLTSREVEVLQLIAEGNANKQTASKLGISIKTVEKHRQHVMTKLGIHETATLTRFAVYAGIA